MSDGYRNSRSRSAYDDQYARSRSASGNERTRSQNRSGRKRKKKKTSFMDYLSDLVYAFFMAMPWNRPKKKRRTTQPKTRAAAPVSSSDEKEITIMRFSSPRDPREQARKINSAARLKRKKRRKRMRKIRAYGMRLLLVLILGLIVYGGVKILNRPEEKPVLETEPVVENRILPAYIEEAYLKINPYSRPGADLLDWKGIIVHQTDEVIRADEMRKQWNQRGSDAVGHSASHFIIDTNGDIKCCIPIDEVSYASDNRRVDTISIAICRNSDEEPMNEMVRDSLEKLVRWICGYTGISYDNVMRHYDVSGRSCPEIFVSQNNQWEAFIAGLKGIVVETPTVPETEAPKETEAPAVEEAVKDASGDDEDDSVELGLEGEYYGDGDEEEEEVVDDLNLDEEE